MIILDGAEGGPTQAYVSMKTLIVLIVLSTLTAAVTAFSETGYKRTPWGSKSWNGPGAPPHWTSRPPFYNRPVDPGWGVRPPFHRPDRWGRGYYYQNPAPQTIIIEEEKQVPVYVPYVPAQKQASPLRCGGRTVTRKDPVTGELIIEYVSSSRTCPE